MDLLRKLYGWAAMAGGVVLAIAAALFFGERKGASNAKREQDAAMAKAEANAASVRNQVDADVANHPAVPSDQAPQPVGTADADSSVGRLRDDGWSRD